MHKIMKAINIGINNTHVVFKKKYVVVLITYFFVRQRKRERGKGRFNFKITKRRPVYNIYRKVCE